MLDTRVAGRDRKVASRDDIGRLEAPDRSMLGAAQEQWLAGELAASTRAGTPWQVLGQQVMFAPQTPPGEPSVATDSWDGYRAARDRVFDIVETVRPSNFVVLTGDAHSAWAYDLARRPYDAYDATTGRGAVGVELVGTSITSPTGLGSGPDGARQIAGILDGRPHLRYLEPRYRGYLIVDMTRERLQADWFTMSTVDDRSHEERFDRAFVTEAGRPHLVETSSPAPSRADMPPPVAGV
jgi:alkaline phosphatase D